VDEIGHSTDLREEKHLKLSEECQRNDDDDDDTEMQSEVRFEFADVGRVKREPDDKEAQEQNSKQPEIGFVHYQ
jgi:hypothetical protein